jgi:hypothetical protein
MSYLEGWVAGTKMVSAGFTYRECRSYSLFMMKVKGGAAANGFMDAVLSGAGA